MPWFVSSIRVHVLLLLVQLLRPCIREGQVTLEANCGQTQRLLNLSSIRTCRYRRFGFHGGDVNTFIMDEGASFFAEYLNGSFICRFASVSIVYFEINCIIEPLLHHHRDSWSAQQITATSATLALAFFSLVPFQ